MSEEALDPGNLPNQGLHCLQHDCSVLECVNWHWPSVIPVHGSHSQIVVTYVNQ